MTTEVMRRKGHSTDPGLGTRLLDTALALTPDVQWLHWNRLWVSVWLYNNSMVVDTRLKFVSKAEIVLLLGFFWPNLHTESKTPWDLLMGKLKPCWNKGHEKGIFSPFLWIMKAQPINHSGLEKSQHREGTRAWGCTGDRAAQCYYLPNQHILEGTKHTREQQPRPAGSL